MTERDLTTAYADAMAELEHTLDLIDRYGPTLIRRELEGIAGRRRYATTTRTAGAGSASVRGLPPIAARLVREIADDAAVRAMEREAA